MHKEMPTGTSLQLAKTGTSSAAPTTNLTDGFTPAGASELPRNQPLNNETQTQVAQSRITTSHGDSMALHSAAKQQVTPKILYQRQETTVLDPHLQARQMREPDEASTRDVDTTSSGYFKSFQSSKNDRKLHRFNTSVLPQQPSDPESSGLRFKGREGSLIIQKEEVTEITPGTRKKLLETVGSANQFGPGVKVVSTQEYDLKSLPSKKWQYGVQIVHQKETIVSEERSTDEQEGMTQGTNSDTSFSLQATPDLAALSERRLNAQGKLLVQGSNSPVQMPSNFLVKIDENDEEVSPEKNGKDCLSQDSDSMSPDRLGPSDLSPEKDKALSRREKRLKSRQIKKILKERLNIVDLRMLGDESTEDPNFLNIKNGAPQVINDAASNHGDSFHVLMKEIGGAEANPTGLSKAFIEKNGEAEREELNSFTEMFSVRDLLGFGAFGVVLLVKNRYTQEKSALKIIAQERLSQKALKILKNESTIMRTMNHPSVVSLKRIFENSKFIVLEMELIPGGQLKRLFKLKDSEEEPKPLTDLQASQVMLSLLKGVAYVHARDIVHRDLKPENILLATEDKICTDVKIVDFGLSAEQNWRLRQSEKAGTLLYMAPEQVTKKGYSKKVDLWACGIIAYQLLTCGKHPIYQKGDTDYCKKLEKIETKPIEWRFNDNFSPLARDFFLNLVAYPPSQRYDAATALQHPWITRSNTDKIPLSQQQEFAMFEQEKQLRKVMRLVYFASHVKMTQFDTLKSHQTRQECDNDSENQLEPPKQASKGQLYARANQSSFARKRLDGSKDAPVSALNNKLSTEESDTESGLPSAQRTKRFKRQMTLSKASGGNAQAQATPADSQQNDPSQRYYHSAFLSNSFTAYKELLLSQASTQSTSAESKNHKSDEKPEQKITSLEDTFKQLQSEDLNMMPLDKNWSKKGSPLKKQKTRLKRQQTKITTGAQSPTAADGSPTVNITFNPGSEVTATDTKVMPQSTTGKPLEIYKLTSATKVDGTFGEGDSESDRGQIVPQQITSLRMGQAPARSVIATASDHKNNPTSFLNSKESTIVTQGRKGRNLLPMKSPEKHLTDKGQVNKVDMSASKMMMIGGHTGTDLESMDSLKLKVTSAAATRPTYLQTQLDQESNNVHPYFAQKSLVNLHSSPSAVGGEGDYSAISGVGSAVGVPQTATAYTNMTDQSSQHKLQLIDMVNQSTVEEAVQQVIDKPGSLKARLGDSQDLREPEKVRSPSKREHSSERRFHRKLRLVHQATEVTGNGNGNPTESDINDMMPSERMTQQTNETFQSQSGVSKQSKSAKKRIHQKRNYIRGYSQTAQKQVGSAHGSSGQFDPKKVLPHVRKANQSLHRINSFAEGDQKIDWFQMIQAEKTVGGSRILNERFQGGGKVPIFEKSQESQRASIANPQLLNSDYFVKTSNRSGTQNQQPHGSMLTKHSQLAPVASHHTTNQSVKGSSKPGTTPICSIKQQPAGSGMGQTGVNGSQLYYYNKKKDSLNSGGVPNAPGQKQSQAYGTNTSVNGSCSKGQVGGGSAHKVIHLTSSVSQKVPNKMSRKPSKTNSCSSSTDASALVLNQSHILQQNQYAVGSPDVVSPTLVNGAPVLPHKKALKMVARSKKQQSKTTAKKVNLTAVEESNTIEQVQGTAKFHDRHAQFKQGRKSSHRVIRYPDHESDRDHQIQLNAATEPDDGGTPSMGKVRDSLDSGLLRGEKSSLPLNSQKNGHAFIGDGIVLSSHHMTSEQLDLISPPSKSNATPSGGTGQSATTRGVEASNFSQQTKHVQGLSVTARNTGSSDANVPVSIRQMPVVKSLITQHKPSFNQLGGSTDSLGNSNSAANLPTQAPGVGVAPLTTPTPLRRVNSKTMIGAAGVGLSGQNHQSNESFLQRVSSKGQLFTSGLQSQSQGDFNNPTGSLVGGSQVHPPLRTLKKDSVKGVAKRLTKVTSHKVPKRTAESSTTSILHNVRSGPDLENSKLSLKGESSTAIVPAIPTKNLGTKTTGITSFNASGQASQVTQALQSVQQNPITFPGASSSGTNSVRMQSASNKQRLFKKGNQNNSPRAKKTTKAPKKLKANQIDKEHLTQDTQQRRKHSLTVQKQVSGQNAALQVQANSRTHRSSALQGAAGLSDPTKIDSGEQKSSIVGGVPKLFRAPAGQPAHQHPHYHQSLQQAPVQHILPPEGNHGRRNPGNPAKTFDSRPVTSQPFQVNYHHLHGQVKQTPRVKKSINIFSIQGVHLGGVPGGLTASGSKANQESSKKGKH